MGRGVGWARVLHYGRTNGVNGAIFRLELPKRHVNTNISMQGAFSLGPGLERALSLQMEHRTQRATEPPSVLFCDGDMRLGPSQVPCFLTSHSALDVWNVKKYGANGGLSVRLDHLVLMCLLCSCVSLHRKWLDSRLIRLCGCVVHLWCRRAGVQKTSNLIFGLRTYITNSSDVIKQEVWRGSWRQLNRCLNWRFPKAVFRANFLIDIYSAYLFIKLARV